MSYKVPFVNYRLQYKELKQEINKTTQRVLSRGDLILRKDVKDFEKKLADFVGVKYAVGLNSGTDGLFLSLLAAGIGKGDEVITVSHTFIASIAPIVHVGAKPILVDVGDDFLMDLDQAEEVITKKTKAIIPVYLNGRMCDMGRLTNIARKHNLIVIEDAAQALGASFKDKIAGSFGFTGFFSFYPAKVLGCFGDGGAVTTNNSKVANIIRLFRDHGQKTKTKITFYGWNSRLDNLQAAFLNMKFKYLKKWIKRRRDIARLYGKGLFKIGELKLPFSPDSDSRFFDVFQNYVLRAQRRNDFFEFLKKKGIETLVKDPIPLHWQKGLFLSRFHLPYTEQLAKEVISLPMYPELTGTQIEYVIDCVKDFYSND
ncbi:DegT/DnrJ/EryC1/StrS family aminotransferase [Patescibacteria group bacterium]|nr:DegT/DnrJ/EryC1/StrS family aminotransferase [Patescibacteria group bacterium]